MFQTFTGREYLAIDIASNFGLDKKTWDERIEWYHQNESSISRMVNDADEPALFYAGHQAMEAVKRGEPIGYMISLDATSSGLQLLACLTGDRLAAEICNVVDTGKREDAYTRVYTEMVSRLGEEGLISRDDTKQAIMTSLYGSRAEPKEVFGEGILLATFYQTISDMAPGAWELNEAYRDLWNPEALSHDWVLPDNFHVQTKVIDTVIERVHFLNRPFDVVRKINRPTEKGLALGANTTHSLDGMIVREMTRRCYYNPTQILDVREALAFGCGTRYSEPEDEMLMVLWKHYQASGFLSARIFDYIRKENVGLIDRTVILDLINSLPKKPFKVLSIHDCFRCLPHYGNDLRRQYTNLLAEVAKSNLLSYIVSQLIGREAKISKLDPKLYIDVYETNYALS